jgi:hypothetical protein
MDEELRKKNRDRVDGELLIALEKMETRLKFLEAKNQLPVQESLPIPTVRVQT